MTDQKRSPRTFDALRERKPPPPNPDAEILRNAVRKLATTAEGKVFLNYMRFKANEVPLASADDGALRENVGVRRFIANIEAMIASVAEGNH